MTEREVMVDLVRFVGVLTYGKERWFKQNGCWYDRMFGDYIQNEVLLERITEAINDEIEDRPTGECRTCGRNVDNGGVYEDGRTKCPIQEHYALLLDGYCHLYEPYNCGAKMRGEEE